MIKLLGDDESAMQKEGLAGWSSRNRALFSATNRQISGWLPKSEFRRNKAPKESKRYYPYGRPNRGDRGYRGGKGGRGGPGRGSNGGGSGIAAGH